MSGAADEAWRATFSEIVSPIEAIIEEARNGRMFILVDDEGRENEGDLVMPSQMATPEAINFMATHGRGLICLSLTRDRVEELGLPLMERRNATRHQTAFTVSIEAKHGVTTGISAPDRALDLGAAVGGGTFRHFSIITEQFQLLIFPPAQQPTNPTTIPSWKSTSAAMARGS